MNILSPFISENSLRTTSGISGYSCKLKEKQIVMKKLSLSLKVVVFSLLASILLPDNAPAQVSTLGNWTSIYHGSSSSGDVHYTIQPGSYTNRVLVVAIASGMTVRNNMSVSITYGGQALTLANGDMDSKVYQHTALYYLNEAGLEAASSDYLAFTVSGGTIVNTDVWAALFNYVNQGTPLTDSQTTNSGSSSYPSLSFSSPISPLTINAFNQAVEVVSSFRDSPDAASTIGYATNWTSVLEETAFVNEQLTDYSIRNGVANRSIPSSDITDPSSTTFTPRALASMTALSLSYQAPPAPSVQASNITFTNVTSSSFTINWTSGNGSNRIVLIKAGSAVDSDPVDNTTYIASNLFGSGSQLGTDNFVVYNGTGSSVAVDNLDANTTYYVAIYEFTVITGVATYLTPGATGSQLTGPETAQSGDYRSNGSGNWSTPDIWQTFNGTSWITATSAPTSSDGVITIRDGHTITVADAVTVDQVEVKSGGKVTVNSGVTWTIADGADAVDCNIDGTLYNQGTIATTGALAFSSGSTYQHAENGGTIPTATWDANSTCLVTGITDTAPSGFGQSFGNFTWDCESQTQTVVMNSDVTVKGSFRLISTKAGELALTNSTSGTLSVLGDYYQTGGTFNLNSGSASTATANLQVAGNFYFTGGTITESSSGSNVIIFDGSGNEQTYTSGGTFSNTINFTVNSGAYLQMGTGVSPSYISGSSGTFTLSAGATLGITDHYGITTSATSSLGGNIRVYPRNFDSGANYIYNGIGIGSASQNTGDGLPGTVNSLTFNNSGGSVSFTSTCFITNNFVITAGTVADLGAFSHTAGTLTLGVTSQPSGSYGSSASDATFKNDTYFALTTGIVTVKNGCTGGTWIGVTSSDWNTSSNWCGGIPTSSTDVIITSSVSNYPVVSATPTAVCHSLTINSGASLTIGPSGSSTVATGLTNNGTLNLQSDATGTASLILGSYVRGSGGTENVQLYLTGGNWHYISSPVSSLSTDVFTTGPTGTLDLAAYYEDRISSNQDNGWIAYDGWRYSTSTQGTDSTFSTLSPGQGYDYYNSGDQTFIFGGDFNTGDVSSTLLYNSKGSNPPVPQQPGF